MPIEPIKIPQNVYIEDRIVGPLTLRQVIIVAIGGGFSYTLYAMIAKAYGAVSIPLTVLVWIPGVLSVVFAFIKINDLSMLRLVLLTMERINKPATRTWSPRQGLAINIRTFEPASKEKASTQTEKKVHQLDELTSMLDSPLQNAFEKPAQVESLDDVPMPTPEEEIPVARPVDPSRVSASPMNEHSGMDIVGSPTPASAPTAGSVSIFRDISPKQ